MLEDTAEHTLIVCREWNEQREELLSKINIGQDENFSLTILVREMLGSEEKWKAGIYFANTVMLSKEVAERERQQQHLNFSAPNWSDSGGSD